MPGNVGLLLASLDSEDADAEICMDQEVPEGVSYYDLNLFDFLLLYYLLVHKWLLHVYVQHRQVSLLVRYKQLLVSTVPEDGGVDALVGVSDGEELSAVGRIETLQVLVVRNGEHKVRLHHDQNLHYAYSVQVLVFLGQLEYAFLRSPVLGRLKLQKGALGVSRVKGYRLTFLNVEAGDPYIVIHGGGIHRGEVLHDLQRYKPGVHQ